MKVNNDFFFNEHLNSRSPRILCVNSSPVTWNYLGDLVKQKSVISLFHSIILRVSRFFFSPLYYRSFYHLPLVRYYIKDRNVLCEVKMNIAQSKCNKYVFAFSSLLLTYFICINVIPTVQGCFVTSLVRINTVVLEKTILKCCQFIFVILLFVWF